MISRFLKYVLMAGMLTGVLWLPASVIAQDNTTPPGGVTIHVVQRGENLFRIALSYGLTTDELAAYNGITDPGSIQVGQRLLIPTGAAAPPPEPVYHTVQAGETLQSIASLYDKTVEDLAQLNNISDVDTIYAGQVLTIEPGPDLSASTPEPASTNASSESSAPFIHIVQPGETLFRIGLQYGLTVNDLATANGIEDPSNIDAGDQLIIPGVNPPPIAQDLPAPISTLQLSPLILVEGQAGHIQLTTSTAVTISGTLLNHSLPFVSNQGNTVHTAFFGIPLFTDAGIYPLSLSLTDTSGHQTDYSFNVQVVSGGYLTTDIELPDGSSSVLLDQTAAAAELAMLQQLTSAITPQRYFTGPMGLPAAAAMNAGFGTRRSYNGGDINSVHTGADFAGLPGTPILAAAAGKVVLADTLTMRGLATVIDHGWGVYTLYAHQSEQLVHLGDMVQAGQTIGKVGSSGRVTGPHLHWEVWIDGVPVDPMQWVQQSLP